MHDRQDAHKKGSENSASGPKVKSQFQSRPFALPAQSEEASLSQQETPDLQTQLDRARRLGPNLSRVKVKAQPSGGIQPQPLGWTIQRQDKLVAQIGPPKPLGWTIQRQDKLVAQIGPPQPLGRTIQRQDKLVAQIGPPQPLGRTIQRQDKLVAQIRPPQPLGWTIQRQDKLVAQIEPTKPLGWTIQRSEVGEEDPLQRSPLATSITPLIQHQDDEQDVHSQPSVQRAGEGSGFQASTSVESGLASQQGGGSPLDEEVRSFMEPRFGNDFSGVRIHTGSNAVSMNKELHAQAFTHGSDIYFNEGKYNPGNNEGKRLLAHELTHVVQQTGAVQPKSVTKLTTKENKVQAKKWSAVSSDALPAVQLKENPQEQTGKNNQAQPAKLAPAAATATESGQGGAKPQAPAAKGGTATATPKGESSGGTGAAKQNVIKQTASGSADVGTGGVGDAKSPASPQDDPAFQAVVNKAKGVAQDKKKHDPAQAESKEAQDASEPPANEVESKAQDKQVQEMNQQQPGEFNAEAFKTAVMEKVDQASPKTLEDADKFKDSNLLDSVGGSLSSQAKEAADQAAGPVEEKTKEAPDTSGIKPKEVKPLEKPEAGAKPSDIGAAKATPKPKPEAEVSAPMKAESQKLDQQMAEANVTEEQLANSNEPQFVKAVGAKKEAQAKAVEAPQTYRQQEQATLNQAQTEAQTTSQTELEGMQGQREQLLTQVTGRQDETKTKDEQERTKIANDIDGIYQKTKSDVEGILNGLDTEVTNRFKLAADTAKQKFEEHVAPHMEEYKQRYDGIWGAGRWVKDKLLGVPPEVTAFFTEGRNQYRQEMDTALTGIANYVAEQLNQAKQRIDEGRQKIQEYVASLPEALQQVGTQAAQDIQSKFDELEQSVKDKETQLVDTLAQQYTENLQQLDAQIDEMKASNQPWFAQAFDAMAGAIESINKLKDMLMGVLAKAASAIGSIIKDPIGFLGHLVSGIRQGLDNFVANIMTHLQTGLMGWLTGAMGAMGLQLPEDIFSLQGIFSLATQILGLTWDYIRSKAVKMFGEPIVAGMEETVEIFQIIANQGPMGLWEHVQDQFGDLKETVIEEIKGMLITQVIMAGVKWIIGLLNPASAFVKAAMAIYDIVMFFVNQGSQVVELVGAITDAVVAIASGAVGGAAKLVENALAKSLPVVIGFMASLLGIGDLAKKVQGIVKKVRDRIDKAIDKVLQKARNLFKGKKGSKEDTKKEDEAKHKKIAKAALEKIDREEEGKNTQEVIANKKKVAQQEIRAAKGKLSKNVKFTIDLLNENKAESEEKLKWKAEIAPNTTTEDQEEKLEKGGRKPSKIKRISFASSSSSDGTKQDEFPYEEAEFSSEERDKLKEQIGNFVGQLEKAKAGDSEKRKQLIKRLRGRDNQYSIEQGPLYGPFIQEEQSAISQLKIQIRGANYLLSLERGGSLLADKVSQGMDIPKEEIPKQDSSKPHEQQQNDLEKRISALMRKHPNDEVTMAVTEVIVSGTAAKNVVSALNLMTRQYPNLRFKLLLQQETLRNDPNNPNNSTEGRQQGVTRKSNSNRVTIEIATTQYILGEDVDYQAAKNSPNSNKPVIVFAGSRNEKSLAAYQIIPEGDTTARDILIDLVNGAYNGLLPGVL
jgi:ABC-type cobalt transport system substrate-binding protein